MSKVRPIHNGPPKKTLTTPFAEVDLGWFSLQKYAPLADAPLATFVRVLRDRLLIRNYTVNSPFLSDLTHLEGLPKGLRVEMAIPGLEEAFSRLQENPLSPLFPDSPLLASEVSGGRIGPVSLLENSTILGMASALKQSGWPEQGERYWNSPAEEIRHAFGYARVDLRAPDDLILKHFKTWLTEARSEFGPYVSSHDYIVTVRKWAGSGALPLIDLELFRLVHQQKVRQQMEDDGHAGPPFRLGFPEQQRCQMVFPRATELQYESLYRTASRHKDEMLKNPYILSILSSLI